MDADVEALGDAATRERRSLAGFAGCLGVWLSVIVARLLSEPGPDVVVFYGAAALCRGLLGARCGIDWLFASRARQDALDRIRRAYR